MIYTFYELCWFFLIYSFLGWCAGVFANALHNRKFVNTGFMNMPFCLSYGICAVLACIFLPELRYRILFLFVGGALLGAFVSTMTGLILERIFHRKWWDFSKNRFQYEGYFRMWHLAAYGAAIVLMMKVSNPLVQQALKLLPYVIGKIILTSVYVLLAIDFLESVIAILELKIRLHKIMQLNENMQKFSDEFGNVMTGKIRRRIMRAYPNIQTENIKKSELEKKRKKEENVAKVFAQGCCFTKIFWLFLIGSFIGDIVETFFCRYSAGVWMSRSSVVYGPFSIVWGLGCAMFTALLYKYKDKSDRCIFALGTVLGGAYEYACSVFTELVFGTVFWDYSKLPFNLGGRINLLYCFFWGIAAVVWLKIIYPKLSEWIEKIPRKTGKILTMFLVCFMIFNAGMSALALNRYNQRQQKSLDRSLKMTAVAEDTRNGMERFFDKHFPDSRMERIYPNAKTVVDGKPVTAKERKEEEQM